MTTPYEATGRACANCREEVEDYTGHWEASEATLCENCYDDNIEEWQYRAEVVHKISRKNA